MDNHKFVPTPYSKSCKICYQPLLSAYHLEFIEKTELSSIKPPENTSIHLTENSEIVEGAANFSQSTLATHEASNQPDCSGHTCPACKISWFHNYKCWPGTKEIMRCPTCFANAGVEINRDKDMKQIIAENENVCSPGTLAQARLEHEAFVVQEFGKLNYEEQETAIIEHINKMRALVELYCAKIAATKQALKGLRQIEESKLTPEELEQYVKLSRRQKKLDVEGQREEARKEWKKDLAQLTRLVGNESVAKEQMKKIYESKGKEIPND